MNRWYIVHKYMRLVDSGHVPPIKCKMCGYNMQVMADENSEPMLKCFWCDNKMYPGVALLDRLLAAINANKEYL